MFLVYPAALFCYETYSLTNYS